MTQIISTTKRTRRPIDGVLLLDKPVGPSSSRVLGHVKHLLKAAKAGHGGTLDPMASGLLPLMFGESTKYAAEGLDADKTYIAEIALGRKPPREIAKARRSCVCRCLRTYQRKNCMRC